jgi:hypothetical protein
MATPLRLSRNEEHAMTRGIIRGISKVTELETSNHPLVQNDFSGEEPTLADLVLPGTGHNFTDEFACLLGILGAERESA